MVKIKKKNTWKPIELDSKIFVGGFDGLVGIEECTDYDLNDFPPPQASKRHEKLKKPSAKKTKQDVQDNISPKEQFSPSKTGTTTTDLETSKKDIFLTKTINIDSWKNYMLNEAILEGIQEKNFEQPTEIQALTLPAAIMGRRDILGAAETGSGKTLAFGLPILHGILKIKELENFGKSSKNRNVLEDSCSESEEELEELNENGIGCVRTERLSKSITKPLYALILTPTRELAIQIKNHLSVFTKYTGINMVVIVGGMAAVKQERILSRGPEVVIATPGRLWELIQSGNNHLSQINNIRFLAIDETDRMLERGHFQELYDLLERINIDESIRKKRQNFVFSATLTLTHELPKHLITKNHFKTRKIQDMSASQKLQKIVEKLGISDPKIVDITKGKGTSSTLTECRITCDIYEKDYYVYYFLQKHVGRTLIFCNSIGCVKRLANLLNVLNCNPLPLHASMAQRQRLKNLERFRDNDNSILVATDVAARGLDIPCIEHVLHYQTPRTSESYVHRSGRTARASREGITILLIEPSELQNYLKLCRTLGKSEDIPHFPVQEKYLNAVKKRVNLARELDKLDLQLRKTNSESGWLQKAADDMDIIIDDFDRKFDTKQSSSLKKASDYKRKELQSLLEQPLFPKGFSSKYPLSSGQLNIPMVQGEQFKETAIEVMKNALVEMGKKKRKTAPIFKPLKKIKQPEDIKLPKFKKKQNKKIKK